MTIKSAISVIALSAALIAGPAMAQTEMMIGTQTVTETDAEAVKARCMDLRVASETESLVGDSDSEADAEATTDESNTAGEAAISNEPETDAETALSANLDLDVITLEDCEAAEWTHDSM